MLHSLAFVLAAGPELPDDGSDWPGLVEAQRPCPNQGRALRLFRLPEAWPGSLDELVSSGHATIAGSDPLLPRPDLVDNHGLICDAVVPQLDVPSLWIGVYALRGEAWAPGDRLAEAAPLQVRGLQLLDRFPLAEAANETCWFYPTETGTYLCWENQTRLALAPGWLPEQGVQQEPITYDRGEVHVLWSLMADDDALTCVGLTYQGRRIEWPLLGCSPEPSASWTCFEVDTMADPSYRERARITVFGQ